MTVEGVRHALVPAPPIRLRLTAESTLRELTGFRYLWIKRVQGFVDSAHCAKCLKGEFVEAASPTWAVGGQVEVPAGGYDYLYLCGVSPRWATNLHAPMVHAPGEGFAVETYNGFVFEVENARRLQIPEMTDLAAEPYSKPFWSCRNFQFGWAAYRCKTYEGLA